MMDKVPSDDDIKARSVGTHVWKMEEKRYRKSEFGSQCGGSAGSKRCKEVHDMIASISN